MMHRVTPTRFYNHIRKAAASHLPIVRTEDAGIVDYTKGSVLIAQALKRAADPAPRYYVLQ